GVRYVPSADYDMDMGLWPLLLHSCGHQLSVLFMGGQSFLLFDSFFNLIDIPNGFATFHFAYRVPEPCYLATVRCILLNLFVKAPKGAFMLYLGIIFQVFGL